MYKHCGIIYVLRKEVIIMATPTINVRIDPETKKEAAALFEYLGLDMSSAITLFLRQCILRGGLPFSIEVPKYTDEMLEAFEEARRISSDPNVKGYTDMDELEAALMSDDGD